MLVAAADGLITCLWDCKSQFVAYRYLFLHYIGFYFLAEVANKLIIMFSARRTCVLKKSPPNSDLILTTFSNVSVGWSPRLNSRAFDCHDSWPMSHQELLRYFAWTWMKSGFSRQSQLNKTLLPHFDFFGILLLRSKFIFAVYITYI